MGKHLTKHERACVISKEILDDFARGEKLSKLLQKAALLARLTDDSENLKWIDKEITGVFDKERDAQIILQNGRLWGTDIYRLDHVEVLETMIESQNIRLAAASDPDISYTPASPYQHYTPHSNQVERYGIAESIRINQSILSRINGLLYTYVQNTYYTLNYSEVVTEIFSSTKKRVELELKKIAPESLTELMTAYNLVNSNNHANWSNVASSCRRVLMQIADKIYPPSEKTVEDKKGKKIKLDADHWRLRIKEHLKGQKYENAISRDTLEYLSELIDSVGRLCAEGDKKISRIDKSVAEKILFYTYLILADILERK
jgi:hypothetical protein